MNFLSKLLPAHTLRNCNVLAMTVIIFYSCNPEKLTAGSVSHPGKAETAGEPNAGWQEQETAYTLTSLVE